MKLYIDCDPGIDDAFALGYLLTRNNVEIVGIGSVLGNENLEKVHKNLRLITSLLRPDIPIFKGSVNQIIETFELHEDHYHGEDGLAGFWQCEYYRNNASEIDRIMERCDFTKKSAVLELINLSLKYEGELVILTLGPLTNVAIAQLVDPLFGSRIKKIVIMGGNFQTVGNSQIYVGTEFNFSVDPESVQIVFNRIQCPKIVVPMDALGCPSIKKEMFIRWKTNDIFENLMNMSIDYVVSKYTENPFFDLYAAFILLHPEIVTKSSNRHVAIELRSDLCRGKMIIVDSNNSLLNETNQNWHKKFSKIELIEELDENKVIDVIKKF